jgi:hypothetical protein
LSDDRQRDIAYQHRASRGIDLLLSVGVCVTSVDDNLLCCEVFREDSNIKLIYLIFIFNEKISVSAGIFNVWIEKMKEIIRVNN